MKKHSKIKKIIIALMRREPFDYTQWRQRLFKDVPLDTFLNDAQKYRDGMVN